MVISYSLAHGRRAQVPLVAAVALGDSALNAVSAARARRLLASPSAQRGFSLVGGSLLCGAGIWALISRRLA